MIRSDNLVAQGNKESDPFSFITKNRVHSLTKTFLYHSFFEETWKGEYQTETEGEDTQGKKSCFCKRLKH